MKFLADEKVQHTIASQTAGGVSSLLFFPLDTIRSRFMSQDGTKARQHNGQYYTNTFSSMRVVLKEEGIGTLFRASHLAVFGTVASWGFYMMSYRTGQQAVYTGLTSNVDRLPEWAKSRGVLADESVRLPQQSIAAPPSISAQASTDGDASPSAKKKAPKPKPKGASLKHHPIHEAQHFAPSVVFAVDTAVSTAASLFNAVLTTPVWHVKTRIQVEDARAGPRKYKGFVQSMHLIATTEGVRTLWRGCSVQMFMSVWNAPYLPLYEALKRLALNKKPRPADGGPAPDKLTFMEVAACSAFAKTVIAVATNPLFVIRTRMQDARYRAVPEVAYDHIWSTARLILVREGVPGFFRGAVPSMALTALKSSVSMIVMEELLAAFRHRKAEGH